MVVQYSVCSKRYLLVFVVFLSLNALPGTHSLGFTNIFGVIHHKTDEEAKHLNDFLEEEDATVEHLAWFPQQKSSSFRNVDDVSTTISNKKKRMKTKIHNAPTTMDEEEFLELLIQLQD